MFSSLSCAFRGTCGVEIGIGTPPLIVPLRKVGLDEGLRLMVAVWEPPIISPSPNRLTVEVGRLDWANFLNWTARSEFRGMVEDLSKSDWLRPWCRWWREIESMSPCREMDS